MSRRILRSLLLGSLNSHWRGTHIQKYVSSSKGRCSRHRHYFLPLINVKVLFAAPSFAGRTKTDTRTKPLTPRTKNYLDFGLLYQSSPAHFWPTPPRPIPPQKMFIGYSTQSDYLRLMGLVISAIKMVSRLLQDDADHLISYASCFWKPRFKVFGDAFKAILVRREIAKGDTV